MVAIKTQFLLGHFGRLYIDMTSCKESTEKSTIGCIIIRGEAKDMGRAGAPADVCAPPPQRMVGTLP